MKILWFSNTPANADEYFKKELKGTGGWLKALDQSLQKHVDLHVAFYNDRNITEFKYGNTNYYPIFRGRSGWLTFYRNTLLSKIVFYEDVQKYLNIVHKVKPDLIHIHGTENPFGYIQNQVDVPVCISIQGNINVYHHKYFSGFERRYLKISAKKMRKLCGVQEFKVKYKTFSKMKKREKEILLECKNILGRTDWDYHITRILAPESTYFHVNEILRNGFYKHMWKYNDNEPFVLFTTTDNLFYKGLETICLALSLLKDYRKIDIKWRIAGISEQDSIVKIVKKKLGNLYPKRKLHFLGRLNEKELIAQLLDSSVYVMASHIENSPNNLCEAMVLGLPCISTYAGGTGSLIEHGRDGVLVQDGDPWAMAGAIIKLLCNSEKAVEIGASARKKALLRHDRRKVVDDLQKVYSKIISMKN